MGSANQQSTVVPGDPAALLGGRYQVEAELGQGGMARVYRVVDQRSGQHVALKQLVCSEDAPKLRAMLEREYHTLVQLEHPRIVHAFDYGLDPRGAYYTMELLEGHTAREAVKAGEMPAHQLSFHPRLSTSSRSMRATTCTRSGPWRTFC